MLPTDNDFSCMLPLIKRVVNGYKSEYRIYRTPDIEKLLHRGIFDSVKRIVPCGGKSVYAGRIKLNGIVVTKRNKGDFAVKTGKHFAERPVLAVVFIRRLQGGFMVFGDGRTRNVGVRRAGRLS